MNSFFLPSAVRIGYQASELLRKGGDDASSWGEGVTAILRRFDEVARWVSTSILAAPKLKQRAKVLQRFIRIADVRGKKHLSLSLSLSLPLSLSLSVCVCVTFTLRLLKR